MGIVDLQVWVRKRFKAFTYKSFDDVVKKYRKIGGKTVLDKNSVKEVKRLFLDFNALIHEAKTVTYEKQTQEMFDYPQMYWSGSSGLFANLMEIIEEILIIVKPTELLYIASDGVVTKAKMMEQRSRSLKSDKKSYPFNSNNIKPGTEFMNMLNIEIRRRLRKLRNEEYLDIPIPEIEFSDSSLPGEGEHKIMERFAKGKRNRRDFTGKIDVIYSPDSDMHLLAMLHQYDNDEVVIMRHRHNFEGKKFELHERYEYFNTTKIKNAILGIFDKDIPVKYFQNGRERRNYNTYFFRNIKDFILITIFAGNDFLPALPFGFMRVVSDRSKLIFDYLTETYTKTFTKGKKGIVFEDGIRWETLLTYLQELEENSNIMMGKIALEQKIGKDKFVSETEDRTWKILENSSENKSDKTMKFNDYTFQYYYQRWASGTYHLKQGLEREDMNFDLSNEMCNTYLEGISWIMAYYEKQTAFINTTWAYTFNYPPDLMTLTEYLLKNIDTPKLWTEIPHLNNKTLHSPLEHLLSIVTYEELNLLPNIVVILFMEMMPHIFVKSVVTDNTLVQFDDYTSKAIINFPSIAEVQRIFDHIRYVDSVVSRNGKKNYTTKIKKVKSYKAKSEFSPEAFYTFPDEELDKGLPERDEDDSFEQSDVEEGQEQEYDPDDPFSGIPFDE